MYLRGMKGAASDTDELVRLAVINNANWCDVICRSQGLNTNIDALAWTSPERTPPFYPDAVTVSPTCSRSDFLGRIDHGVGCSVKDSFAVLDLSTDGFQVLFDANWIVLRPDLESPAADDAIDWRRVATPEGLHEWILEWNPEVSTHDIFRPSLLSDPRVSFLAGYEGDRLVAGAALLREPGVIGLSNFFCQVPDEIDALNGCVRAARTESSDLPIVGYESGAALDNAIACGFDVLSTLRVWMRD